MLGNGLDREPLRVTLRARGVRNRELELAGQHRLRQFLEVAHDGVHPQAGIRGRHAAECNAERHLGREHVGAEHDLRRLQAGEFLQVAREVACLREDPAGVVDHEPAGLAGFQRPGGRVDELGAERALERSDALQQRFRREAERPGGAREVPGRHIRH